jgi:hypothetical protein
MPWSTSAAFEGDPFDALPPDRAGRWIPIHCSEWEIGQLADVLSGR